MCNTCGKKSNNRSKKNVLRKIKKDKCPENVSKKKETPKCPKPKRPPRKPKKCLTEIEKIMLRIQPPIADRERYLHPEHVNCFLEESDRIYIKKPKYFHPSSRKRKICSKEKKNKKKKKSNDGSKIEKNKEDKTKEEKVTKKEENSESDTVNEKKDEDKSKKEDDNEKRKIKNKAKKNKKKKEKRDIEEDTDSEISICSVDSEICLVGLALSKEDKKKIEENRRKVHPQLNNDDKIAAEGNKNVEEETSK